MSKVLKKLGLGTLVTSIAVGGIGLALFLYPIVSLIVGWFGGLVISWVFGSYLSDGLNLLLGTDRFSKNDLPMICATFAVIGSYFKANQVNNNK